MEFYTTIYVKWLKCNVTEIAKNIVEKVGYKITLYNFSHKINIFYIEGIY